MYKEQSSETSEYLWLHPMTIHVMTLENQAQTDWCVMQITFSGLKTYYLKHMHFVACIDSP